MNMPLTAAFPGGFTVLMAVYNGDDPGLFERAVRSIFANTLLPDGFLLVVDGPVPRHLDAAVKKLKAEFVFDVLYLPENKGLAGALNAGLDKVNTEWIARADADDENLPDRFAKQALIASLEAADVIGGAICEVDRAGRFLAYRRPPADPAALRRFAKRRNPLNHMTVAMRASVLREAGGYPELYLREDYGLWATLLKMGARLTNMEDVLVYANAGSDMICRRGGWRYARAEIELQRHLVRTGLKGRLSAVMDGLLRASVFLLPGFLRKRVYSHILRG